MHTSFFFIILSLVFPLAADDWKGADYAKNSQVQVSHAEKLLLSSLTLQPDATILDIGCGDGKISARLAEKVPYGKVIGIDPSDSMLEKAESMRSGTSNLFFEKGSAEDFAFEERFDHIISIHVMHWVKEQEKALANIRKALKSGGQIHFIFAPSKEGLPFHTALEKTVASWSGYFESFINPQQVYDMESYRKMLVKAGFHIEGIHYVYHEIPFENKAKLQAWIKQWQPHAKSLPIELQDAFLTELINTYILELGIDTKSVPWGEYVFFIEAS